MPWSITVDLSRAVPMLEKLATDIESTIPQKSLQAGADQLVTLAKSRAPVRTGALRDSIQRTEASAESATVEAEVEYSGFVEFGTSRMSAEPYMTPSIPEAVRTIEQTATQLLRESIG